MWISPFRYVKLHQTQNKKESNNKDEHAYLLLQFNPSSTGREQTQTSLSCSKSITRDDHDISCFSTQESSIFMHCMWSNKCFMQTLPKNCLTFRVHSQQPCSIELWLVRLVWGGVKVQSTSDVDQWSELSIASKRRSRSVSSKINVWRGLKKKMQGIVEMRNINQTAAKQVGLHSPVDESGFFFTVLSSP